MINKIKINEGFRAFIYKDTLGFETIGYGFKVDDLTRDELALNGGKVAPMNEEIAEKILILKIQKLEESLKKEFRFYENLPQNVKEVLLEMAYQMGILGVKKFRNTLIFIEKGDYKRAYENALKSLWAKQTPNRAKKVLAGLLNG